MQQDIRVKQADKFLYDYGLLKKLGQYGNPHLIGSYRMNMMAWNDLDIDVENENVTMEAIYEIVHFIFEAFHPTWFEGKQETSNGEMHYFIGFETMITGELWNFDIWFFDKNTIMQAEAYCDDVMQKVARDLGLREAILDIKQQLWNTADYSSIKVYDAVLNHGIRNTNEYLEWLKKRG